jgi:hypothetical protein
MKHRIAHNLPLPLAQKATRAALEAYRQQFPQFKPGGEWLDAGRAKVWFQTPAGRLDGAVNVVKDAVELELDVPFLLRPFKGQAISIIENEVNIWIEKARRGELG